jgi:hypothetical protein
MTSPVLPGRVPGLPKRYHQAYKRDVAASVDLKNPTFNNQDKVIKNLAKIEDKHPNPKVRAKTLEALKQTDILDNRFKKEVRLRKMLINYRLCYKDFSLRTRFTLAKAFVDKNRVVRGRKYPFGTTFVDGYKEVAISRCRPMVNNLIKKRIVGSRLAQEIYPNSNKVAPHAGDFTWDGPRVQDTPSRVCKDPYSDMVSRWFKDHSFWNPKDPSKDPEMSFWGKDEAKAQWKEFWGSISTKDRKWTNEKYLYY